MKNRYSLGLCLFGILGYPLASHAADPVPVGLWHGVVSNDGGAGRRIATSMEFKTDGANVTFREPASCRIQARYVESQPSGFHYIFRVSTNGGPFCDALANQSLDVKRNTDKSLGVVITAPKSTWRGTFEQDPSKP